MRLADLRGKRVAVWGAGREGTAALSAIAARLPELPITVFCSDGEAQQLRAAHRAGRMPEFITQAPDLDRLRGFDVVVKSPGISAYKAPVPEATAAGVQFISGSALWFAEHPAARVIVVTGTKGKSTTATLIAHLLRAAGKRVALAGNIGVPLLELFDLEPLPEFWVVELSSFQTRDLDAVPEVAVLLNLYPEHLDWHLGEKNYYSDKLRLFGVADRRPRVSVINARAAQTFDRMAIGELSATVDGLIAESARIVEFGSNRGFDVVDGNICDRGVAVFALSDCNLPGIHNALNLCAACAAVSALGIEVQPLLSSLREFRPLPHRMQALGVIDGIEFVNDSIATTPHATLAALAHYHERAVTVLVGGYDRGLDWSVFRAALEQHPVHAVIAMGANGARIEAQLQGLPEHRPRRLRVESLDAAMTAARKLTPPGGVILLSPGAPSFGAFRDYVERGRCFAQLAGFDPDRIEGLGL